MESTLVFDIETVQEIYNPDLVINTTPISSWMIENISGIWISSQALHVFSFSSTDQFDKTQSTCAEHDMVKKFMKFFKATPTIVSYNGRAFDLPILQNKAIKYGIVAPEYWDVGDLNPDRKWKNYHGRFLRQHVDMCDLLSNYGAVSREKLDTVAKSFDLPGKLDCNVGLEYVNGNHEKISMYCKIDVINTALIYFKYLISAGRMSCVEYNNFITKIKDFCTGYCGALKPENAKELTYFLSCLKFLEV